MSGQPDGMCRRLCDRGLAATPLAHRVQRVVARLYGGKNGRAIGSK